VMLHAAASVVLFAALLRLTRRRWRSAFVAAVFALHPLHVESVAWISARKDPLSGLFFAAALLAYARERESGGAARWRLVVLTLAVLGWMSKPTVVALPFVMILIDVWPLERTRGEGGVRRLDPAALRRCVLEKWPLFLVTILGSVVTIAAQRSGGAVASLAEVGILGRLANAAVSCVVYLRRFLWPSDLAVFYPHLGDRLAPWAVPGAVLLLLAISAAAWQQRVRRPYFLVGWLWFLVTLAPVSGIVQVGSQAMADRYMYLPLIGLAIAITWGASDGLGRRPGGRVALGILGVGLVAAQIAATSAQLVHWRNSEALFRRALAVTERNHVAHSYLGAALLARGETEEAIAHWREALRLRADLLTVTNNLAWLLATTDDPRHRDPEGAVRLAERAAEMTEYGDPAVLDTLAAAYASARRFGDAGRAIDRAITLAERSDAAFAAELEGRRALYRRGRPYRERVR